MPPIPYSVLAPEYDRFVGHAWFARTRRAFERLVRLYAIRFRSAADLGCGTGLFARYLSARWRVPVFAVDRAAAMLRVARVRCGGAPITILHQDLRALRLPACVDLVTANFDTVNHLLSARDLACVFRRVSACLAPGGHFIFDVVTNCQVRQSCGRRFCRSSGPVRQCVTPHCASNLVTMSVEIHDPCGVGTTIERHVERLYAPATIGAALRDAGFVIRGVHDAATLRPADRCPPRLIVVARR